MSGVNEDTVLAEGTGCGVSWTQVRICLCHYRLCDLGTQLPHL